MLTTDGERIRRDAVGDHDIARAGEGEVRHLHMAVPVAIAESNAVDGSDGETTVDPCGAEATQQVGAGAKDGVGDTEFRHPEDAAVSDEHTRHPAT